MYKCQECGKEFDSSQKLGGHVAQMVKRGKHKPHLKKEKFIQNEWLNENGKYSCPFCQKEYTKAGISTHIWLNHDSNYEKRASNIILYNLKVKEGLLKKPNSNQFIKAKNEGYEIFVSEETKKKISTASKKQIWDDERRKKLSDIMLQVVEKYPESYSAKNVSGRTKKIKTFDSFGNEVILNGNWEILVSEYLNICNIKWTNIINEIFRYKFENKQRRYFPDFYLPEYNIYIEVKGYVRERDLEKWKVVKNLIVLKKGEIKDIKNNNFSIFDYIKKLRAHNSAG